MGKKVLVAYGSKYGSTAEIAEKIGAVLAMQGMDVDVLSAEDVRELSTYSAAVVGGAVYIGRWHKPAAKFLKKYAAALAGMPVWLFSSGPTEEGDPVELLKGWTFPSNLQQFADQIKPRSIAVFHGNTNPEKASGMDKWMLNKVGASLGDFRDWNAITAWAEDIAAALAAQA
ncbi:MAG: flavodoxin domain-containing protein [Anaerolineales bacterium]|nr:flavodoxin domain-containing protein [Anaerolineales bacterium]